MKAPRIAFNKDAVLHFLLSHGEKLVVGLIGLAACGLAWGGVSAFRDNQPKKEETPDAIVAVAKRTEEHIDAVSEVPDEELVREKGLPEKVARWLAVEVKPLPPPRLFNTPLFAELDRRGSPEILPIEDLRAVAGAVVLAMKPKPVADRPGADRPQNPEPAAKPAKPGRGGRPAGPLPGAPQPPETPAGPLRPDPNLPQGKIVPYVLVTGLIPVAKQQEEYQRKFQQASFRDIERDSPAWSGFWLEKTEVRAGAAEKWTPVDMKAVARRYSAAWAGVQPEPLLPVVVLTPDQQERRDVESPIPFCSPMPQLLDGSWGLNALHPWFPGYIQRTVEEQGARAKADQEEAEAGKNVLAGPGGSSAPLGIGPPGMPMVPSGAPAMASDADAVQPPEYRLFRFIDLDVKPGRTYRYRIATACWNPNLNVASRHLVDANLAKVTTLKSPLSAGSPAVLVPDGIRMLVQPQRKIDPSCPTCRGQGRNQSGVCQACKPTRPMLALKRLKAGTVVVNILGQTTAGGFGLRWLLMDVGGLANVVPAGGKRGDPRSQGEAISTDRVLLDVRGRLEDPKETRSGKPTSPPEPLEMIFLRPDGVVEVASAADSQVDIDRYLQTLQPDEAAAPAGDRPPPPPPAAGDLPFGNPLAPKK